MLSYWDLICIFYCDKNWDGSGYLWGLFGYWGDGGLFDLYFFF